MYISKRKGTLTNETPHGSQYPSFHETDNNNKPPIRYVPNRRLVILLDRIPHFSPFRVLKILDITMPLALQCFVKDNTHTRNLLSLPPILSLSSISCDFPEYLRSFFMAWAIIANSFSIDVAIMPLSSVLIEILFLGNSLMN